MLKFVSLIFVSCMSVSSFASQGDFFDEEFTIPTLQTALDLVNTNVEVGTFKARPNDVANVIFLPGFADRFNNHEELLTQLHESGMRVISYNYPGHGLSTGVIWFWGIKHVAGIMKDVLNSPQLQSGPYALNRRLPVILVGWSTGGTIAIRTAQAWAPDVLPQDMRLAGVVAITPALLARPLVGDGWSRLGMFVKAEDLTRNPRGMRYPPKPSSTIIGAGGFAASLELASIAAKVSSAPNVPTMLMIADNDQDKFAFANLSANWVKNQPLKPVYGFQCKGAKHGLEFEPDGVGELTRLLTTEFVARVASAATLPIRQRTYKICPAVHQRQ